MKPARLLLPIALALSLAACGGGAPDPAAAAPQAVPVTVVTLGAGAAHLTRELPGRTSASLIAEVRPQVSGLIQRRLFTEGGFVRAGQPLYQIDAAAYRADTDSAQAALARARATAETARLNARRSAELVKIDAISRQDDDNAQAAYRQAQADVRAAEAGLQGSNVTLGRARITAPISGWIGRSTVTQGALVTAGQAAPLATVQQLDPIHIDLSQSSAELLATRRAMEGGRLKGSNEVPVKILLEDGSPHSHEGRLAFSETTVDPSTGRYTLRVVVPNPDGFLLPGMYVRAVVESGVRPDALLVPQRAVQRDPKGATSVFVVGADNTVAVRPITVSRTVGDAWLVEDGLKAGDRVVVEGLQKIRPGAPVIATDAGAKPAAPQATKPAAPAAR